MSMRIAALILVGCFGCQKVAEETVGRKTIAEIAEEYCTSHPELPCGHVYACDTYADNRIGKVEICIPNFTDVSVAEASYGFCELSPDQRFLDKESWLCWWCCGEGCGRGCNAYSGCFCPETEQEL